MQNIFNNPEVEVVVVKTFKYSFSNTSQKIVRPKEKIKIKKKHLKGLKEAGFIK